MEKQTDLEEKFLLADSEFNHQDKADNEICEKTKKFIDLVLGKLDPNQYMELTFRDCSQNDNCVVIGKGWVGTKTRDGYLTFEPVSNFDPCISRREYPARILRSAITNPDRAKIGIRLIRRHEFNSCYFEDLDSFLKKNKK